MGFQALGSFQGQQGTNWFQMTFYTVGHGYRHSSQCCVAVPSKQRCILYDQAQLKT